MSDLSDYKRLVSEPEAKAKNARIRKLESALRRYGRHDDFCAFEVAKGLKYLEPHPCTCGFSAALGAAEQEADNE